MSFAELTESMSSPKSSHSVPIGIRYTLIAGPYTPPPSNVGGFLEDERFGLVEVSGYTGGRIPWPTVGRRYTRGKRAIILCSPLTEALKLESVTAIRYWWGVSRTTVARWKRTVNARPRSEGSQRLYQVVCESVARDPLIQNSKSTNPVYHSPEFLRRLLAMAGNRGFAEAPR
jgi:hypothetical protein